MLTYQTVSRNESESRQRKKAPLPYRAVSNDVRVRMPLLSSERPGILQMRNTGTVRGSAARKRNPSAGECGVVQMAELHGGTEEIIQRKLFLIKGVLVENVESLNDYLREVGIDAQVDYGDFPGVGNAEVDNAIQHLDEGVAEEDSDFWNGNIVAAINGAIIRLRGEAAKTAEADKAAADKAAADAAVAERRRVSETKPLIKRKFRTSDISNTFKDQRGRLIGSGGGWHIHEYTDGNGGHVKLDRKKTKNFELNKETSIIEAADYLVRNGGMNTDPGRECYYYLRYQLMDLHGRDLPDGLRFD